MRLASSFSPPPNLTVDRSGGVKSITGGFSSPVIPSNITRNDGINTGGDSSKNNSDSDTSYTKKISLPNGGIKMKLITEPPNGDIAVNSDGNKNVNNQSSINRQQNNTVNNNTGFNNSGVSYNYGVTNTQTDRLKAEGFEDSIKGLTFGGVIYDSSVKR